MTTASDENQSSRNAVYQDMLRAVPGLDAMYGLVHSVITSLAGPAPHILVVGAGGGREIREFRRSGAIASITALDPSSLNLDMARSEAKPCNGAPEVRFVAGTLDDLPVGDAFGAATSLLVMHHLADDGAKLRYLQSIRERLVPGGLLVHADVCFDESSDFERLAPLYLCHARHVGVSEETAQLELGAVPRLPFVSGERTSRLFTQAGFAPPHEIFRTLWYRCWISARQK